MMTTVTLKNGYIVNKELARDIFSHLKELEESDGIVLWHLAMKCRKTSYVISRTLGVDSTEPLINRGLLHKNGTVPEYIRQVVINSVKNIDKIENINVLSLRLQNPWEEKAKAVSTRKWSWRFIFPKNKETDLAREELSRIVVTSPSAGSIGNIHFQKNSKKGAF